MTDAGRRTLVGILLLLAGGALIGWFYEATLPGLAIAALAAVAWLLRNLLAFEKASHTGDFKAFGFGEGIWQQLFSKFSHERERGDRYKRQLRQVLKELRKSTNAMPDAAIVIGNENEIINANRAARNLVGIKPKKDRGQRVENIIRDPELSELLSTDNAATTVDIESPFAPGRYLNCRIAPYGAGQKLLLIRDITERMRLSKMRRDFVANASHELRSPLTVISGYLDYLAEDQAVPADLQGPIAQMQRQSQRMTTIVGALLQLSRLENSGRADVDAPVNVAGHLSAVAKAYRGLADAPAVEVLSASETRLLGAEMEIESVIENLVSNAVRHTPPGGRVELSWHTDANGGVLKVADNGEGIPEEQLPRITERFFRVDRGRAREDGGVGLGMAIVKHVLQRHDAELEIESELGRGSTFSCHFPVARLATDN